MARIVVLGAGLAGHYAALHLRRKLSKSLHDVIVVSPGARWHWAPALGRIALEQKGAKWNSFALGPLYRRKGILFHQARATTLYPQGTAEDERPQVEIEFTSVKYHGEVARVPYDYLINCTGPRPDWSATAGLDPELGYCHSLVTPTAAAATGEAVQDLLEKARQGQFLRVIVGAGHGQCPGLGAMLEFCLNLDYLLRREGLRGQVDLYYLSNTVNLGDFGVGGAKFIERSTATNSGPWLEGVLAQREITAIHPAAVHQVRPGSLDYEDGEGVEHTFSFDLAVLMPRFSGVGLDVRDRQGQDISHTVFSPEGFMLVDALYDDLGEDRRDGDDWPQTYCNGNYSNIFAAGSAFAPPYQLSPAHLTPGGTEMVAQLAIGALPAAAISRTVAMSVVERVKSPKGIMGAMPLTKVASIPLATRGAAWRHPSSVLVTIYPLVPDRKTFPEGGRSERFTYGRVGRWGAIVSFLLRLSFTYRAKASALWWLIPD